MRKVKKIISMLLAAGLVLGAAGCGEKEKETSADKPVQLTWYLPGDQQEGMERINEAMNKILREKIGAEVKIQFIDQGAYQERMTMMMSSGDEFDLCHTGYVLPYIDTVNKGGILPLNDIIEKVAPDMWKVLPDYAKATVEHNGEVYGVPNVQIMARIIGVNIRKDLAEKYNLDVSKIKTIYDLEPYWETIKQNEKSYYPTRMGMSLSDLHLDKISPIYSMAFLDNETGKMFNYYESDWYKKGIADMHRWYQAGYIRSDIATVGDESADMNAGKYATEIGVYKPGGAEELSKNRGIEYISIPLTEPVLEAGMSRSTIASVGANSKNPEKAVELIYLMNTDKELYNLMCFGEKDVDYTLLEDGIHVKPIEKSGYYQNCSWKFGNIKNAYLLEGAPSDMWEQTNAINESAYKSKGFGFSFDTANVRTQISQIATVLSQYKGLTQGTDDPETVYPVFLEKLKTGGMDDIYQEVEKQFNEWMKGTVEQ